MSLFFRSPERRDVSTSWAVGLDIQRRTAAGEVVTPDSAMKLGAVWSSVNLLASVVSNLPVDVFTGSGVNKVEASPQPRIVAAPSLIVSRREWVYQAMTSLLLRGNAYGYVMERDNNQRPTAIEWLNPDSMKVAQESALSVPTYKLGTREIPRNDIVHMRAFVQAGSAVGLSPIEWSAEQIGMGLAAQRYGAQWFGDGGHPTALFQNKAKSLDPEAAATIKERILGVMRGRREPLVVGADWDYKPLQVSAAESQFIESQGYTDAQIARLYGPGIAEVLGFAASGGGSLTYSNRVDRSLDLLTYAVMPWVNKFEDMLTEAVGEPQSVRFNTNALLRADNKARFEAYKIGIDSNFLSDDEVRALEDRPPLELSQEDALVRYAEPLGALVRAGFEPAAALVALGLDPIKHTGLVPITVASPKNPKIGGESDVISA